MLSHKYSQLLSEVSYRTDIHADGQTDKQIRGVRFMFKRKRNNVIILESITGPPHTDSLGAPPEGLCLYPLYTNTGKGLCPCPLYINTGKGIYFYPLYTNTGKGLLSLPSIHQHR